MITEDSLWIEPKGFEQFPVSDWSMWTFLANSSKFFDVQHGDRRYFANWCSNKYINNKAYFDNIFSYIH